MLALLLIFSQSAFANPPPAQPVASPVAAAATPVATATPQVPLTDAEKKKLSSEFQKALSSQRAALSHQEKTSMKELYTTQSVKKKKWTEDEKKARHDYFDAHMSGPDRRQYVQNYLKKKQDFDTSLKMEISSSKKSWAEKNQALKQSQKELETQFNTSLSQGIRPPQSLWPTGN